MATQVNTTPHLNMDRQLTDRLFSAALSDDIGNFFVQCDNCHVWQHGGCMGLNDESIIPDEYYCEKCRPDFHKIIKGSNLYVGLLLVLRHASVTG